MIIKPKPISVKKRLNLRLDETLLRALTEECKALNLSRVEVLERLIDKFLKGQGHASTDASDSKQD